MVRNILRSAGNAAAVGWRIAGWYLLAVLLIAFAIYLRRVGLISREMHEQMS